MQQFYHHPIISAICHLNTLVLQVLCSNVHINFTTSMTTPSPFSQCHEIFMIQYLNSCNLADRMRHLFSTSCIIDLYISAAFYMETLRFVTSAHLGVPRTASADIPIRGYNIPKGIHSINHTCSKSLNHNCLVWKGGGGHSKKLPK